jgi:acetylornithine deacetylase/succinyl-diaminopimelate desuccinylase family protein
MAIAPDVSGMKGLLGRLVAFNTENPPGRELELARCLAQELSRLGLMVRTDEFAPGRTNVIATYANGGGPVLAFNSHLDVVPAGEGWSRDPWKLTEADGRLYGRGSCDAKGAIVAMIETIRFLIADAHSWSGTLLAIFVADEEVASLGSKRYVSHDKPVVDFAVIGEPTSNRVVTAHKGSLRPVVRVFGKTAHSGMPDLGVNAIFKASHLLRMIEELHGTVSQRRHELVGSASLTVTRANAGHADNVVPDRCDLLLDRRMVPGEGEEAAKQEIETLLEIARREFGIEAEIIDYKGTTGGPTETRSDHPVVVASLDAARRHGDEDQVPHGFQGGCDLVHFRSIGAHGTVIGPGSLSVAHKPNEFVPIDELVNASRIYYDTALNLLASGHAIR